MKLTRPIVIPAVLLAYLAVLAYIGFGDFASGRTSPLQYFGTIALTLVIIVLLHFSLKRRERLRRERQSDLTKNEHKNG